MASTFITFSLFGCSGSQVEADPVTKPTSQVSHPSPPVASSSPIIANTAQPTEPPPQDSATPVETEEPMCPAGMIYVDTTYCSKVERRCVHDEWNKPNHIVICHEFAAGEQKCLTKPRRQRFCIDKYEYPNREGAHPPVMVDWYDAAGACAQEGKRLCWESEWVAACEGPEKLPFPYGLKRDPNSCNIDNPWKEPVLEKIYSKDPTVQDQHLTHLDQSVPSGSKPDCKSGFGVYDMTGNVDEWVNAEQQHDKSLWVGLKGGAWGHVRNACRPMTTSHPPDFTYYFVSFRCCADPKPDPQADEDPTLWKPPPQHDSKDPTGSYSKGWLPPSK